MSSAHRGETRRITHHRQRLGGFLDRRQLGGPVIGQPPSRDFVYRSQRLEQQRARNQHTGVAEHQIEVHATLRNR